MSLSKRHCLLILFKSFFVSLISQWIRRRRMGISIIADIKYKAFETRASDPNVLPSKIYLPFAVLLVSSSPLLFSPANKSRCRHHTPRSLPNFVYSASLSCGGYSGIKIEKVSHHLRSCWDKLKTSDRGLCRLCQPSPAKNWGSLWVWKLLPQV